MKFTLSWIKKFIDTSASLEEICGAFNKIGHEVEEVVDNSELLKPFVIGEIQSLAKHPDADKLNVCQVFDGTETRQVICGASNVSQGIKIVLARPGDKIPANDMVIKKAKIRGVESHGMICSEEELGLADSSEGIMILDESSVPGVRFVDTNPALSDPMIHLSITPNRSDCLGVYGLARDLAAFGLGNLKEIDLPDFKISNTTAINVEKGTGCSAFSGVVMRDVTNKESPEWMKNLLSAIGSSPKNFLVDVTNYINYSFGRPLHVFDLDKLDGDVSVRFATKKEKFQSLDGKDYELNETDVVIADSKNIQALGGIIGGDLSKSELSTKNILIESAIWDPIKIAKSARYHQIETDSKHRFERGVDSSFARSGAMIAAQMVLEFCGGKIDSEVSFADKSHNKKTIDFKFSHVEKIAGFTVQKSDSIKILTSLGCKIKDNGESAEVEIPSWRHDLNIGEDLVEEVLRIHGYDHIPSNAIFSSTSRAMIEGESKKILDLPYLMGSRGYHEVITWSFMSSVKAAKFGFDITNLEVSNPISQDLDVMRPSILPNLIDSVEKNNNRGIDSISVFEIGHVYQSTEPGAQTLKLAALRSGFNKKKNIFSHQRLYDVFDAKEDLILILSAYGYKENEVKITQSSDVAEYLHPTQSARIILRGREVGIIGALHPVLLQDMGLANNIVYFELDLDEIKIHKSKFENIISNYQKVERDFAFLLSDQTPIGDLVSAIRNIDKRVIRDVTIFDIYKGSNVEDGKKSIAFNTVMQSDTKGLEASDIENYSAKIIEIVEKKFDGILRDK